MGMQPSLSEESQPVMYCWASSRPSGWRHPAGQTPQKSSWVHNFPQSSIWGGGGGGCAVGQIKPQAVLTGFCNVSNQLVLLTNIFYIKRDFTLKSGFMDSPDKSEHLVTSGPCSHWPHWPRLLAIGLLLKQECPALPLPHWPAQLTHTSPAWPCRSFSL